MEKSLKLLDGSGIVPPEFFQVNVTVEVGECAFKFTTCGSEHWSEKNVSSKPRSHLIFVGAKM